MKNEDKKVPDAPDTLYVCPFHTGLTSGFLDEDGNLHGGYPVWHGMENRMSADDKVYINLCKVWHPGKELPESKDDCLLYFDDCSCNIGHRTEDFLELDGWRSDFNYYPFEEIVQWAYLKDIVPALIKLSRRKEA